MPLSEKEDKAMTLVVEACRLMGWVIAFNHSEETKDRHLTHIIIGDKQVVNSMISEVVDPYVVMLPPK
jgi:hypothetical protein